MEQKPTYVGICSVCESIIRWNWSVSARRPPHLALD